MASRAVAACAASGSDKQRAAKPALAVSAQAKTTNSVLGACSNRCRRQSRRDSGVGPAPLRQAWVLGSYQMRGACTTATVASWRALAISLSASRSAMGAGTKQRCACAELTELYQAKFGPAGGGNLRSPARRKQRLHARLVAAVQWKGRWRARRNRPIQWQLG